MHYVIIAYDGRDEKALERRLAAREAHLAGIQEMQAAGSVLLGAALLDGHDRMIGSVLICEFPSRQEVDNWLTREPYVTGRVWEEIEVKPCKVPPMFLNR